MKLQTSIRVNAPRPVVWAVMSDVERWPTWTESISRVERLDGGEFGVGSTVRIKQPKFPPAVWRVTEFEPERSFTWTATSPGIKTVASHRIADGPDDAVEVTLTLEQSGPLAPVLALLAGGLTRRYVQMEADRLKQRSERA